LTRRYHDNIIGTDVVELERDGTIWRFPEVLAGRFEVESMLATGGFGALFTARDRKVFKRRVLVKTGLLGPDVLSLPNNASIPDLVKKIRERFGMEKNFLLHGQARQIDGIPVLLDAFLAPSPMIRGPHSTPQGDVFHDDPACWRDLPHLVLGFFDGIPLDNYCLKGGYLLKKNPFGFLRYLGTYLSNILDAFHRPMECGNKEFAFSYQDLKPANILVSERENRCCLIDFGGAAARVNGQYVNAGVFTAGFAPPEARRVPIDPEDCLRPAWDVYCLGATLKETVRLAGVENDVPAEFREFIAACMADDPANRPQTMSEVTTRLLAIASHGNSQR